MSASDILVEYILFPALGIFLIPKVIWPSMVANNIFLQKRLSNYGKSDKKERRFSPNEVFVVCVVCGVLSAICIIYQYLCPISDKDSDNYGLGFRFAGYNFFGIVALCIYTFIDDYEFNLFPNHLYLLRAWATCIIIAPVLACIIFFSTNNPVIPGINVVSFYELMAMFGCTLGSFTFWL